MTTIACNKEEMAGDVQFSEGTKKWKGHTKIFRFSKHENTYPHCDFIAGFAGPASELVLLSEYYSKPDTTKPPKIKALSGLILTKDGDIYCFDDYTSWIKITQPYAAIGTGSQFAIGAMSGGYNPKQAVKVASLHDLYTGMGIKTLSWN